GGEAPPLDPAARSRGGARPPRARGPRARAGGIGGGGAFVPALEQFERQPADTGADIQKRSISRTRVDEHVAKEPGRRSRPLLAIVLQVAPGDLLVELCAGDIAVRRAACAHGVAVVINAAYERTRSRRSRRTSAPYALWTFLENSRSVL